MRRKLRIGDKVKYTASIEDSQDEYFSRDRTYIVETYHDGKPCVYVGNFNGNTNEALHTSYLNTFSIITNFKLGGKIL